MSAHYGYDVFHWEGNELFFKEELQAKLIPEDHYNVIVWRIDFLDGTRSKDVYNKTHAKENAMKEVLPKIRGEDNVDIKAVDAF